MQLDDENEILLCMKLQAFNIAKQHRHTRGVLRKYLYVDAQSRLQNVDHLYTCVLQKKKKNTRSLHLTCMTKPTHLYTIFTEMMAHYYHFHQQNSPLSYHHRNKGSLIYLEQFQNHPIGIPKLMKMHLKTFEHPRTPCFRECPPPPAGTCAS